LKGSDHQVDAEESEAMKQVNKLLLLSGVCLLGAGMTRAQAPPGPLTPPPAETSSASAPVPAEPKKPEVQPRKNIMGAWKFNKDESDDGRAKLKQTREAENTNRGNGGSSGGPRMSWPGGPMGGGGYGGQRFPQGGGDVSDSMADVVNPPREIKFSQKFDKDPEVLLSDDREHRVAFYTDGRKLQKEKEPSYQEVAAHWDDKSLVTDEKGSHGGKLSRNYELSSDGKQLIETVHLTDSKGNHPVTVRYVYDATDDSVGGYHVH
jgi:hypothetical protein